MIGEMELKDIESLLKSQITGRIACHAGGITYIVPMSYAYDGEYIYGHAFDGMKIRMMRKNPQICFQTDKMENPSFTYEGLEYPRIFSPPRHAGENKGGEHLGRL